MNPRYPTSNQFRRHRNRKIGRPILLGLMALATLYFIFSSPSPKTPVDQPVEEVKKVEDELPAHLQPSTTSVPLPTPVPNKVAEPPARRLAVIETPAHDKPVFELEIPGQRFSVEDSKPPEVPKELPALVPAKSFFSISLPARAVKPAETVGNAEGAKSSGAVPSTDVARLAASDKKGAGTAPPPPAGATQEAVDRAEEEESAMPSAPKELAPKQRPPDFEMTFYQELARRKVIVPLEEGSEVSSANKTALQAANMHDNTLQTPAVQDKPVPFHPSGTYVVQLAVFTDAQRAATMASDLQKRGVPARVVKSKDGRFNRIRLGPFPSHADATRYLMQSKLGDYSSLIFQDNER